MSENNKRQLEQQLWNIANTLRNKMPADEFRDYILGFIFYKYLSEKITLYANETLKQDDIKYQDINEDTEIGQEYLEAIKNEALSSLGYFLKPSELFSVLAKKGNADKKEEGTSNFILEELTQVLKHIEQSTMGTESEEDFNDLFADLDLTSPKLGKTEAAKNDLIAKVLGHLDKIDFKLEDTEADVLGDAYEYLIGQFASGAGKKAGEFYTPQEVSKVLAKLVTTGKTKLKSVYDPTCGSGSLLLRVAKEVEEVGKFYGQELNHTTYNLARMNMILHDVHFQKFDIRQDDTLEHPQHIDQQFEAIVANPPFSAKWSASQLHMSDDRFSQYGKLAPASKADFAFVQHMVHHLAENGTMAVVLPHGVLFRSGTEAHIRKYLIEDRNYLDAVIGLPTDIFYGTDIATCILVFKKCREQPQDILFIDASLDYGTGNKQDYLREEDINKIVSTYRNRTGNDRYSHRATLDEVRDNKFFLNISRYVKAPESEEEVRIFETGNALKENQEALLKIDSQLDALCKELNIPTLFSGSLVSDILAQRIRFKNNTGEDYPIWKKVWLSDLLTEHKTRNLKGDFTEVFSVAKEKGVINQIDHLGRSYASDNITNYKVVFPDDIVYTKSPTAGFPYGIIKQNKTDRSGVVSVLYAVFKPINKHAGLLLDYFFSSSVNAHNYLKPIVSKGAKNTMNINNEAFLNGAKINFPSDSEELEKVTHFLKLVDARVELMDLQTSLMKNFKKGILQQIFS